MERKRRGWRRTAGALLVTCLLVGTAGMTLAAQTDSKDIGMQVEIGFGGALKVGAWTPVQVTLENQGPDFTGRLLVAKDMHIGSFRGIYEKEVMLPQGASKRYTLDVPGLMLNEGVQLKLLNAKGEEIESKANVTGVTIGEGVLLGGIVEQKDDLDLFALVNAPSVGGKVTAKALDVDELPDRAELLNGLDMLVINHGQSKPLQPKQKAAIETWVNNGGSLVLAGGANYQKGAGQFAELSPVKVSGIEQLSDLSSLQQVAGVAVNANQLTVSSGTLETGAHALLQAGDLPLFAVREVGAGQVLYVAYDLSTEPLASWQGNKQLWGKVLSEIDTGSFTNNRYGAEPIQMRQQLQREAGAFESIAPAVSTSALVFGSYILLVGPLLYLVLRRFNKREWGWALIPGMAAIWALGIYLVGTDQRTGDGMTQFISVVDLQNEQTALMHGGAAFVMNNGGDYAVKFAPGVQTFVGVDHGTGNDGWARIQVDGNQHRIAFDGVEFWSSRTVYAEGVLKDQGMFKGDLHVNKVGQVSGTITNHSKLDLENAHLVIGDELIKVGDLKQGASVQVEQQLGTQMPGDVGVSQKLQDTFAPMGSDFNSNLDEYQLHRALLRYAVQPSNREQSVVQLYGFSKTPVNVFTLEGKTSNDSSYLHFVHQDLNLVYDDLGTVKPFGLIRGEVKQVEGDVSVADEVLNMRIGAATLEYNVLLHRGFVPQKVTTNLDQATYAMFEKELFNWQTNAWDAVGKVNTPTMVGDEVNKYVSPDGKLLIRIKGTTTNDHQLGYPNVGVEGKVSP